MKKAIHVALTLSILALLVIGCSDRGGESATAPDVPDLSPVAANADSQRMLWGMWNIHFDTAELSVTVEPIRNTQAHFNITDMLLPPACDDCLEITVNSFDPVTRILDADVTLRNPHSISGYDVRGILYTNDYGHELRNADDWTKLWDIPGGMMLNPFKAFAKGEANRLFAGLAEHTESYLIYIPQPPAFYAITFAVDASWPGNCKEPYEITNFWQETIYETTGASGNIYVDLRDWQNDVNKVTLVAPEITGEDFTQFNHDSGDTWQLNLTNNQGAPAGDYNVRLIAASTNSGSLALYDFVAITISEGVPDNPVDVTPPWLNFFPQDVCIDGDYAYIAGNVNGLHIFNISDPANPVWVNRVDTPDDARGVAVSGGYAYVVYGYIGWPSYGGLQIIDIDPPESAYIVKAVDTPEGACGIAVSAGYAYVVGWYAGLQIIDISPPESAYIVKAVDTPGCAFGVVVSAGYAYVADHDAGLQIIDIDPPESAHIVKTVATPGYAQGVAISGGYAYVAEGYNSYPTNCGILQIIDIDPPESAYTVISVGMPADAPALDVAVSGGYAYVANHDTGLQIIDIDPPDSAYIVKAVNTPGWAYGVAVSDGYAYVADYASGLQIIDIDPPVSAYIFNSVDTPGLAIDVAVSNGYAHVADYVGGLQSIDIDQPESAIIVNSVDTPGFVRGLAVTGGYSYVADDDVGLQIIDIDPPESAYIVNSVGMPLEEARAVTVSSGYAYMACWGYSSLQIIDIEPPESAYIVNSLYTSGWAAGIAVSDGYAYMTGNDHIIGISYLQIIDINPPESAYIVTSVGMPLEEARGVAVSGGYAYVADGWFLGLVIIDIDPPASAYIFNSVNTPGHAYDVAVSGGYAYVADGEAGLQIIDIDPLESAYIISAVDTPGWAYGVAVSGGYAYVADGYGGLRIIKL